MKRGSRIAPFESSAEHLRAELAWLDAALLALVRATRGPISQTPGHGWFVSPEEAESLLTTSPADAADRHAIRYLRKIKRTIAARRDASARNGVWLSLPALQNIFRLAPVEELLLVACLAGELADRYGQVYGYLHDDLTRRQPSLHLVARLLRLDSTLSVGGAVDRVLTGDLSVIRWELVSAEPITTLPRLARGWWIDPQVASFLLEQDQSDRSLRSVFRASVATAEPCIENQETEEQIWNVARSGGSTVVWFHGPGASEGESIAHRVCRRIGVQLLHADLSLLLESSQSSPTSFAGLLRRVYREALLRGGLLYLSGIGPVLADARHRAHLATLEELVGERGCVTFLEGDSMWLPANDGRGHVFPCYLPFASYATRRGVWDRTLGRHVDGAALDHAATRHAMSSREIYQAAHLAHTRATARGSSAPDEVDLVWACRLQSASALNGLARKVPGRAGWEDLILPEDVLQQLREICAHARHRTTVLHRWGFDRLLSGGKGVYALFVGPGGTGKTLAAEVLATTLDLELIKVDLSSVVSKYIGETEKHLECVFDATERSDAILFFDEADALFGKRSETKDAHDRYANIEVGFLLQRLEAYEGFVILASNLASNIDNAFARRMQFLVEFPFPDEATRLAIWKRHLPADTPLEDDLDLPWLARELKMAGGNIRNVVFNSAFMAAEDGGRLAMRHVMRAAQREYGRLGKVYRFDDPRVSREALA